MCTIDTDNFQLSTPNNEDADGVHTKDPQMDDTAHGSTPRIHCWTTQLPISKYNITIRFLTVFIRLLSVVLCQWLRFFCFLL